MGFGMDVWSIFFPVAVTSSFAFLVYYMRSESDRILTSSSHVGNESGRQGSENRLPLLTKSKQRDIFYFLVFVFSKVLSTVVVVEK